MIFDGITCPRTTSSENMGEKLEEWDLIRCNGLNVVVDNGGSKCLGIMNLKLESSHSSQC